LPHEAIAHDQTSKLPQDVWQDSCNFKQLDM
jgi:hypothetical protein